MFDLEGNLIKPFDSARIAGNELGMQEKTINSDILRKTCIRQSFYLSRNTEFKIPINKANFNPILKGYKMKSDTLENSLYFL